MEAKLQAGKLLEPNSGHPRRNQHTFVLRAALLGAPVADGGRGGGLKCSPSSSAAARGAVLRPGAVRA